MTKENPDQGDQPASAGSVADEATRLALAFAGWARSAQVVAEQAVAPETSADDIPAEASQTQVPQCDCAHGAAAEAVCRNCPVCRAAGLVQAIQPEVLDRVADFLGVVVSGLHAAADQRRSAERAPADGTGRASEGDGDEKD